MFAFRLCTVLHAVHPRVLLPQLSSRELAEWEAYFRVCPFGQDHSDFLVAQLTALFANANSPKNARKYKPTDFLPYADSKMSSEQIKTTLRGILRGSRRDT